MINTKNKNNNPTTSKRTIVGTLKKQNTQVFQITFLELRKHIQKICHYETFGILTSQSKGALHLTKTLNRPIAQKLIKKYVQTYFCNETIKILFSETNYMKPKCLCEQLQRVSYKRNNRKSYVILRARHQLPIFLSKVTRVKLT